MAGTLAAGGDVVFAGAGTSGRLGVLEAAECPPTFGSAPDRIRAVMAGGDGAVLRAVEGAEDREDDGRAAVATLSPERSADRDLGLIGDAVRSRRARRRRARAARAPSC